MNLPVKKLPPGYEIGMRVVTNDRYAVCYPQAPVRRLGTIVGRSKGNDGHVRVHLDGLKYPTGMTTNLFDIVEESIEREN